MLGTWPFAKILASEAMPAVEPCQVFLMQDGKDSQQFLESVLAVRYIRNLA